MSPIEPGSDDASALEAPTTMTQHRLTPEDQSRAADQPVRVCFLIDSLSTAGTETQLLALIRNLDPARVKPHLVLLDGAGSASQALEPIGCPTLRLGVKKLLAPSTVKPLRRFSRFLRETQIDVLQVYFPDSTYFGVLAGRLAGVKSIVRTRNNVNHWMTPTHRRLGRLLNRLVTVTLCNSQAGRDAVLADERPHPASVIVIENGVDLERFDQIPTMSGEPITGRPRRVGMVANLRRVKGVDILVRAAAIVARSHPGVEFHVAGEGPQRPELEQMIADLGLNGHFVLRGKVSDIPGFLATLDVAVLSSRAEGMPNSVLEYMAAGRPIVATAVGGTRSLLEDQRHGCLVPIESPDRVADSIVALLENPQAASQLASAARSRVGSHYSRLEMIRRFVSLYQELASRTSRTRKCYEIDSQA